MESSSKCRILTLKNEFLNEQKDQAINKIVKLQTIIDNWANSHNNLNKILEAQIPHQCQKILGGDIDGFVDSCKPVIENEQTFQNSKDFADDFKIRFVSHSFINQTLIDKHCVTNADGVTNCQTKLSALEPSKINPEKEYKAPSTETILKFPISNGEVHATKETLKNFPNCKVSDCDTEQVSGLTISKPLKYVVPQRTRNPNPKNRSPRIKHCYTCGDTSHKSAECTFDHNSTRADNIKLRMDKWTKRPNSLNCHPEQCYTIFNNSLKRPIEKWVSVC